jgi:hypothetical protein
VSRPLPQSPEAIARFQARIAAAEAALNAELEPYRKRYPGVAIDVRCPRHPTPKLLARGEIGRHDPRIHWRKSGSHTGDYPGRGFGGPWYRGHAPKGRGASRPNVLIEDSTLWDESYLPPMVALTRPPRLLSERRLTFECTCGLRRVVKNERLVRRVMRALDVGQRVLLLGVDI